MIKEYIEKLKSSNINIQQRINELEDAPQIREVVDIITLIENNTRFTEEQLNKLNCDLIYDNVDNEKEKQLIPFLFKLLKLNMVIVPEQMEVFNKIKTKCEEKLHKFDANKEQLQKMINKNNGIIALLSNNGRFESFDILKESFKDNNVEIKEQLEILKEIIVNNSKIQVEEVEEETEKMIEYNNSEEDVINLLKKYGIDYNKFSDENKENLKLYANLEVADKTLEAISAINPVLINSKRMNQNVLAKLIIQSNPEIVNEVVNMCNQSGLDLMTVLKKCINILIPNKHRRPKKITINNIASNNDEDSLEGQYNNFKENIIFFNSVGIDVKVAFEKCMTVFITNYEIIRYNYMTLKNDYDLDMATNLGALSALLSIECIPTMDRLIEYGDRYYNYACDKCSILSQNSELYEYLMKLHETYPTEYESVLDLKSNGTQLIRRSEIASKKYTIGQLKEKINQQEFPIDQNKKVAYDSIVEPSYSDINPIIFDNGYVNNLEKYTLCDSCLAYVLNGTRVSRYKFLRICSQLVNAGIELGEEEIKYALSYGSVLTPQDVANIENFKNARRPGGRY